MACARTGLSPQTLNSGTFTRVPFMFGKGRSVRAGLLQAENAAAPLPTPGQGLVRARFSSPGIVCVGADPMFPDTARKILGKIGKKQLYNTKYCATIFCMAGS